MLLQDEVAEILEVCSDSITGWETGRSEPKVSYYPGIIKFLGYFPFNFDLSTLEGRIKNFRYRKGLSRKKMGELINRDASTIASLEKGESEPHPETSKLLEELLLDIT